MGNLIQTRYRPTATLLPGGKVLLAGGENNKFVCGDYCPTASVEIFDPDTNTWSATASLPAALSGHTATLLPNGNVLVAGGNAFVSTANAQLYSPITGAWTSASSMATGRSFHSATLLPNGKVLVVGGSTGGGAPAPKPSIIASAELYDPANNTWRSVSSMKTARYFHTATLLANGKVLVAGGVSLNSTLTAVASAELYDPAIDSWSSAGTLIAGRAKHAATLLSDGRVLVTGGYNDESGIGGISSAEIFDPATSSWSAAADMSTARVEHTATLLPDNTVLVAGGTAYLYPNSLASAELYDPIHNTWSTAGNMLAARFGHTATLLPNGKVLLAAGSGENPPLIPNAELYDPGIPGAAFPISQGWNLLGNSGGGSLDVTAIFSDPNKVLSVWTWVASKGTWAFYSPQLADGGSAYAASKGYDALTTINSGEGFWLNANAVISASTPAGTVLALTFQATLPPGWSLISIGQSMAPADFNRAASILPSQTGIIPLNLTTLWAWDSGQSKWYFYAPSLEAQGPAGLSNYAQSKGYLDFATTGKTLGPTAGFWVNKP